MDQRHHEKSRTFHKPSDRTSSVVGRVSGVIESSTDEKNISLCQQSNNNNPNRTTKPRTSKATKNPSTKKANKYFKTAPTPFSGLLSSKKKSSSPTTTTTNVHLHKSALTSSNELNSDSSHSITKFARLKSELAISLTEVRRLCTSWRSAELDLNDLMKQQKKNNSDSGEAWSIWRTKVNENLIDRCSGEDTKSSSKMETSKLFKPHVASFLAYLAVYGDKEVASTRLDPEAFMLYGLPRVKLDYLDKQQMSSSQSLVPNKLTIDEKIVQDKLGFESLYPFKGEISLFFYKGNKLVNYNVGLNHKGRGKKSNTCDLNEIVGSINVKEKVKAFENVVSCEPKTNPGYDPYAGEISNTKGSYLIYK